LDFDKTLASIHLYFHVQGVHHCRSLTDWLTAYNKMFSTTASTTAQDNGADAVMHPSYIFGGPRRLAMLDTQLRALKVAGAQVHIITMGVPQVCKLALEQVGLSQYIDGITDDNPKQSTVRVLMNTRFCESGERLRWDQAVLVDDTEKNFRGANLPDEMISMGMKADAVRLFFGGDRKEVSSEEAVLPFRKDALVVGRQGYCYCLSVSGEDEDTGMTEQQFELLVRKARGGDGRERTKE
jgi:hypothetical protein